MVAKKKTDEAVAVAEEAAEAAVEGTPESEEESATPSEEEGEVTEIPPEEKEKKDTFQERIDELRRKQGQAERERDEVKKDRDGWRDFAFRLDKGEEATRKEIEKAAEIPEKPKPDDFDTHEEFYEELADWKIRQQTAGITETIKKELQADREKDEAARRDAEVQEKFDEGREKHEDFDAVAFAKDVSYSDASREVVLASPNAAELAYHLGQNPDVADRISRLSPLDAAREIGIIEAGLAKPKPVKVKESTKASEPINPVGSSGTEEKSIYDEDISQRDYETLRTKQIVERRKR